MGWSTGMFRAVTCASSEQSHAGRKPCRRTLVWLFTASLVVTTAARASEPRGDLTELSLEQLMDIEVTSVSKKEERFFDAPSAVFVITQEDIRRLGATSIPEVLRIVPGLDVAQFDANKWAVSSRGFNKLFATKLLVLIDGRSVYTPLFAGVYWDVQDTLLEDIDRIEVIRGPGGTLWGANAENGVINIITKSAKDTHGALVTAGGGSAERAFGAVRAGAALPHDVHARVYAKYFDRSSFPAPPGNRANDDWNAGRGGFRLDWDATSRDLVTLQGDIYRGDAGESVSSATLTPPFTEIINDDARIAGGNVLGRWTRHFAARSDLTLQLYYDRTEREEQLLRENRDTYDIDLVHGFTFGSRHEVLWGLGYRFTTDQILNSFHVSLEPQRRGLSLFSGFVQDEITLLDDALWLTLGTKVEHNDFTGFEVQPSGRLLWTPRPRHSLWAAISRAVRTPARAEHDLRFNTTVFPTPDGTLNLVSIFGSPNFTSEELLAYEIGYRLQPTDRLFCDVATFYNSYDNLFTIEPGVPFMEDTPAPVHRVLPQIVSNKSSGEAYGVEVAANYTLMEPWRVAAGYTWFDMSVRADPTSRFTQVKDQEGDSPHNQFNARSYLNLPWNLRFDTAVYYVDNLPDQHVPGYIRLDLRLAWNITDRLELSAVGQNLSEARHAEFGNEISGSIATEVPRSGYGKLTWRF